MISKAAFFRFHKYLGLIAAAFFLVQALTGLTLVFGPELSQVIDPRGMISSPGHVDAAPQVLIAAAETRYPNYRVSRLVYPSAADGTFLVHMTNEQGTLRYVSLDRHDGSVLRGGDVWRFPLIAIYNIHDQWLSGRPGMVLVMLTGFALLSMAITGLTFWWPRRSLRKSLAVRLDSKSRLLLRQLHRTTGVLMFPLLLFQVITGLSINIPMVIDHPARQWNLRESLAQPIEAAVAVASRRYPEHEIRDVRMVTPTTINVFLKAPERNSRAVHRVTVDTRTGRVNAVLDASADRALWVITYPLHTGEYLGLAGRFIAALIGLTLAALAAAGVTMWVQARRAKVQTAKSRERKRAGAEPQRAA